MESLSNTLAPLTETKYMHALGYRWYVCDTYVEALVKHKWQIHLVKIHPKWPGRKDVGRLTLACRSLISCHMFGLMSKSLRSGRTKMKQASSRFVLSPPTVN